MAILRFLDAADAVAGGGGAGGATIGAGGGGSGPSPRACARHPGDDATAGTGVADGK